MLTEGHGDSLTSVLAAVERHKMHSQLPLANFSESELSSKTDNNSLCENTLPLLPFEIPFRFFNGCQSDLDEVSLWYKAASCGHHDSMTDAGAPVKGFRVEGDVKDCQTLRAAASLSGQACPEWISDLAQHPTASQAHVTVPGIRDGCVNRGRGPIT